jgi:hypothetical protein
MATWELHHRPSRRLWLLLVPPYQEPLLVGSLAEALALNPLQLHP